MVSSPASLGIGVEDEAGLPDGPHWLESLGSTTSVLVELELAMVGDGVASLETTNFVTVAVGDVAR